MIGIFGLGLIRGKVCLCNVRRMCNRAYDRFSLSSRRYSAGRFYGNALRLQKRWQRSFGTPPEANSDEEQAFDEVQGQRRDDGVRHQIPRDFGFLDNFA